MSIRAIVGFAFAASAFSLHAQTVKGELESCTETLGTLTVVEDRNAAWYHTLRDQYKVQSTVPLIRMLVQKSNCFVVVERGAHAAGIALAEGDGRVHGVIGRHHLAFAEVAAGAHLARAVEVAFLAHVVHGGAALDHHEAVGFLHQHADQRHGRLHLVLIAQRVIPGRIAILDHGERAEGLGAALELTFRVQRESRCRESETHDGPNRHDASPDVMDSLSAEWPRLTRSPGSCRAFPMRFYWIRTPVFATTSFQSVI